MIISRLLKSWAMPPVSLPIASIFCAIASCSRASTSFSCASRPLGGVADDVGKTDQIALVVEDRGDRAGDKEQRAILANAPSLDFVLASLDRQLERTVRFASTALVRPIKYAEMLADDFVGGIADDLFRRAVPAGDASCRVEHENGIVGNALDQNLVMTPGRFEGQAGLRQFTGQLVLHGKQPRLGVAAGGNGRAQDEAANETLVESANSMSSDPFKSACGNGLLPIAKPEIGRRAKNQSGRRGVAPVAAQASPHQRD